jgi:hypothetical protein
MLIAWDDYYKQSFNIRRFGEIIPQAPQYYTYAGGCVDSAPIVPHFRYEGIVSDVAPASLMRVANSIVMSYGCLAVAHPRFHWGVRGHGNKDSVKPVRRREESEDIWRYEKQALLRVSEMWSTT